MSDEYTVGPRTAAAVAAAAKRLIGEVVEQRASATLGVALRRPITRGLGTLVRAIAPSTTGTTAHLESLLGAIRAVGPRGEETPAASGPATDARAPLSPNLTSILAALFDEETPDGREAIAEIEGAVADLDSAFASWHTFLASAGPLGMGPIVNRMSREALRRIEAELAKRIGKVLWAMQRLARVFQSLTGRRLRLAVDLAIAELNGPLGVRTAVGAGLALPGALNDVVQSVFGETVREEGSTFSLGNEVHEKLQWTYRTLEMNNPAALLLASARGQRPYLLMDHQVYFPPAGSGELNTIAWLHKDGTLLSMVFARYDEELFRKVISKGPLARTRWPQYREDVFDLRRSFLYEIKPVRSAALGVIQEYQYRQSFNIVHAAFLDLHDMVSAATSIKPSIRKIVRAISQFSGADLALPGVGAVWTPYLTAFVAEGRVIVPFTVPNLDGLVLYLSFRSPSLARLLALAPLLARQIQRAIQEAMGRLAKAFEEAILAVIAAVALLVLSVLLVELAALLGAAAGAVALATGGRLVLQRLIALVPAAALGAAGFVPTTQRAAGRSDAAAVDAVISGLEEVAARLELRVESVVPSVGAAAVISFAESTTSAAAEASAADGSLHSDMRIDVDLPFVRLNRFPVAGMPLLEVLLGVATLVSAYALLRGFSGGGQAGENGEDDGVVTVIPPV